MTIQKIGDVIEIPTSKGFAYAQYTHKHKQYGALLRVFSRPYETRPENIQNLINDQATFTTFFALGAAVNRKIVSIVGNYDVPLEAQEFPIFRNGVFNPATKKVDVWWFWDGAKEWRVGDITPEQRKLPILGVWNDTLLIERIELGWTAETHPS